MEDLEFKDKGEETEGLSKMKKKLQGLQKRRYSNFLERNFYSMRNIGCSK